MNKGILYTVAAALLGAALMFTPLWFLSMSSAFQQPPTQTGGYFAADELREAVAQNELSYGAAPQFPFNAFYVGLMIVASLALALFVFKQSKKKSI